LDAATRLREVIVAALRQGPFDAVLLTGDICDDGSAQGAAAVHEIVSHCAPIVLGVPGNHDLSAPVRETFGRAQAWLEGWRILGVETQVEGEVPLLSRSTHPWFTLGNAEALAGVVQRHAGPLVLLSGHTHEAFDARLGEAYLYGAPSTYYGIVHEGDTWSYAPDVIGARIVELAADGRVSSTLVTPDRL
jgi:predicted phosphodiesterase